MGNQTSAERAKRHSSDCPQRSPPSKEQSSRMSNEADRKSKESAGSAASKENAKSQTASKEVNTSMSMSKEAEGKTMESAESASKEKVKLEPVSKELNTAMAMSKEGGGKTKESAESSSKEKSKMQSPSNITNMSSEPVRKVGEIVSESKGATKSQSTSKESQMTKSIEGEGNTKESGQSESKEKLLSFSPLNSKMNSQFAPLDLDLVKESSGTGAAGTPSPSCEPLLEEKTAKSPTAKSPGSRSPEMKTAVDRSPKTKEISSRRKTLSERRALAEKERTLTAQKMASMEPISPPKSDIDDHGYVNLAELDLVSARSPSDTNIAKGQQGGIGQNLVMGISGLWSKSMNWWTSKEGESSTRTPVSEETEVQTAQEKSVSARSAIVMITEPIDGRRTVNKHDERYQTLYGLKDPFDDEDCKKNKSKK